MTFGPTRSRAPGPTMRSEPRRSTCARGRAEEWVATTPPPAPSGPPGTLRSCARFDRSSSASLSYFRPEVRGFERLPPRGPFLVVGNHSGGQTPPDLPVLLTAWWRERGEEEPVYALFHSFFFGLPGVGPAMARAGAIEAGPAEAEAILRSGGILIDYPGGRLRGLSALAGAEPHQLWRSRRFRPSRLANAGSRRPRRFGGRPRDGRRARAWRTRREASSGSTAGSASR